MWPLTSARILIIGLDGATLDLVEPWAHEGHLPHLARMMREGCYGRLASTIHPITGAAWPSFMTGMNQGKHGLFDFVRRIPGSYNFELTYSANISAPTLFEIASRHGKRVISVNVPMTFPPRPVNGTMVSGLFAQAAPGITYPHELYDEIVNLVGDYIIMPRYNRWTPDPLQDYVNQLHSSAEKHLRVAQYLMGRESWDLACVVFISTDLAQHTFWKHMSEADARFGNAILDVYRQLDEYVGQLRALAGDNAMTIVMSDHGAGQLDSFVQLNRWLASHGFLHYLPQRTSWRARMVRSAWAAWRHVLPPTLIGRIRARIGRRYDSLRDKMESTLFASRIDWPRTRAYSLGACGNIFINLAGREPQGIVQPGAEYDTVCQEIRDRLLTLADPETGERLVANVFRRDQIYHGPHLNEAADLIITWRDYRYWGRGRYDFDGPDVFHRQQKWDLSDLPLSGTHRPDGVFIAAGANIRPAGLLENVSILDVAPTTLAALGIPVPAEIDGRVLTAIFDSQPDVEVDRLGDSSYAITADAAYSDEEAAAIEQRLKSLGYL